MQFLVVLIQEVRKELVFSRRQKGISFFKVPLHNSDFNKKWGSELINIITKDR